MLPVAIGNPYLQNVYQGGGREQLSNSRGFQQIWLSSTRKDILLQKKLRSYAGHDPPLFRTSGKVQTKSFKTFVLKGYLQSPLSTVQTSINLLLKIKRNRDWKWISNIEICLTGIVASSDYCWLLTQRSLNPIPNIWPWHGLWLCNRACIHIV